MGGMARDYDERGGGEVDGAGNVQPTEDGQHACGGRPHTCRDQSTVGQAAGEHAVRSGGGVRSPPPGLCGLGALLRLKEQRTRWLQTLFGTFKIWRHGLGYAAATHLRHGVTARTEVTPVVWWTPCSHSQDVGTELIVATVSLLRVE